MFSKLRQYMRKYYNLSQLKGDPDRLSRLSMAVDSEIAKGEPYEVYHYAMDKSLYGDEERREWWRMVIIALDSGANCHDLICAIRRVRKLENQEKWARLLKKPEVKFQKQIVGYTRKGKSIFNQLIAAAENGGVEYIDKRPLGGRFWIVGGEELADFIQECKKFGAMFIHAKAGGNATSYREGWWTSSMA